MKLPLLSRVAESVFWMSRYMERADNVARFVNVNLQLMLDAPGGQWQQWEALITASGDSAAFAERYRVASRENVIHFLMYDEQNPNSVMSCVRAGRENARSIRDTITMDMWEAANRLYLYLQTGSRDAAFPEQDLMNEIKSISQQFQGATEATLSHDEAWQFFQLGRLIERADKTTRILDVKYFLLLPKVADVGKPIDDIQWAAALRSVSGLHMYRRLYGRIIPENIVEFLLLDAHFPRAVRRCVTLTGNALEKIRPGQYASLDLIRSMEHDLESASVRTIIDSGLHEFIDGLQVRLNQVGESIGSTFFTGSQTEKAAASAQ